MKGFDAAQRAYDNMTPPEHDEEDIARENWEEDLDLRDVFSNHEIQEIIWEAFGDEPWFRRRLDKAWEEYCKDCEVDDPYDDREAA